MGCSENDRMIPPMAEQFMAQRMNAKNISFSSSHASMVSHPTEVADFILRAAKEVALSKVEEVSMNWDVIVPRMVFSLQWFVLHEPIFVPGSPGTFWKRNKSWNGSACYQNEFFQVGLSMTYLASFDGSPFSDKYQQGPWSASFKSSVIMTKLLVVVLQKLKPLSWEIYLYTNWRSPVHSL